ncbi:copper chaperone PCu(A)C [Endozoicomonas euniceicola]|uniref:Copper chaperone PCu(A)C n=1 Tax=Endozoicomonas euniceicola TaxID=1234143 RepID=A0ABY6GRQ9_9GAMM|nr:copper chaperone PCu(A)C [Endozoicomonas euniceicola]UYM15257.1 copper chaperone PCu(A)C [Endozoicomonas euniceicola]
MKYLSSAFRSFKAPFSGLGISGLTMAGLSMAICIGSAHAAVVDISDPMVRAVPPTSTNTAAYMTLRNNGKDDIKLVSADSSVAERVEIHGHRHEGDKMVMFKMDELSLPVGKVVELKSGSYHIMLMGLKKTLEVGEEVPLTLHFSDSDAIDIMAPVKPLMKTMSKDSHGHSH